MMLERPNRTALERACGKTHLSAEKSDLICFSCNAIPALSGRGRAKEDIVRRIPCGATPQDSIS